VTIDRIGASEHGSKCTSSVGSNQLAPCLRTARASGGDMEFGQVPPSVAAGATCACHAGQCTSLFSAQRSALSTSRASAKAAQARASVQRRVPEARSACEAGSPPVHEYCRKLGPVRALRRRVHGGRRRRRGISKGRGWKRRRGLSSLHSTGTLPKWSARVRAFSSIIPPSIRFQLVPKSARPIVRTTPASSSITVRKASA
jgi:hypothetical protein